MNLTILLWILIHSNSRRSLLLLLQNLKKIKYLSKSKRLFESDMTYPVVNFINVLCTRFSYKKLALKIQSQKVSRKKLLKDFCTKKAHVKRWWNWHLLFFPRVTSREKLSPQYSNRGLGPLQVILRTVSVKEVNSSGYKYLAFGRFKQSGKVEPKAGM